MKRVLMIAFHFPPAAGSSGIQRTLRFVQHLPDFGWEPTVVSAHPRAYERSSEDLMKDVPPGVRVERAFALDVSRHLAIAGRYPTFLGRPDRWWPWRFGAVAAAMRLMREERFDMLWTTYPIATAHQIGLACQRRSGVPWIADFRDPMAQDGYPEDPATWRSFQRIEARTVAAAARSVFTTPGAARIYRERFPGLPSERIVVIENGFDEQAFAAADGQSEPTPLDASRITLVHSGVVYPSERDPTQLFQALAMLKAEGVIDASGFVIRFRASEHDATLHRLAQDLGVLDMIDLAPPVPYRQALEEMLRADALLVMQASNCNEQIPAKLYEYFRAGRPILALTDPTGDTAQVVRDAGSTAIARLDLASEIADLLRKFIRGALPRTACTASADAVARASRRARTADLARLMDQVVAQHVA
jgi:glycosyltransferase involved in cell wall biosynthesis